MGFGKCVIYLAIVGLLSFFIGRMLPKGMFKGTHFPFRCYPFERDGRIYERLYIKKWQNKVPDMSRIFPNLMPRKQLRGTDPVYLTEMIQEACIAELIHLLLCIAGLRCIWLWPGIGGKVISVLNILGNMVFVVIQRYNRPRFMNLRKNVEKKLKQKENCYACADSQLQYRRGT